MCPVNCPYNAREIDNVIKPCFISVPLNISRGSGDILSSYITQSIRDISYCSGDTWNMISYCITNYSHRTPWCKVSQGKFYFYVYRYGMRPKSWSAQLWLDKISYQLKITLNLPRILYHQNPTRYAETLFPFAVVLPYLSNGLIFFLPSLRG